MVPLYCSGIALVSTGEQNKKQWMKATETNLSKICPSREYVSSPDAETQAGPSRPKARNVLGVIAILFGVFLTSREEATNASGEKSRSL